MICDFSVMTKNNSRNEIDRSSSEKTNFNLRIIVEEILCQFTKKIEEKNLEITCLIRNNVPELLLGYPAKLGQVLINLIENAISYTQQGSIHIEVFEIDRTKEESRICFSVSDTGKGILDTKNESLTNRLNSSKFAICKHIVEGLNGEIDGISKEGYGSEFWFVICFQKQENPYEKIRIPKIIRKKRFLIIDNDATNRLLINEKLVLYGCQFDEAQNINVAIKKIIKAAEENAPFYIIIMDVSTLDKNGSLGSNIKLIPEFKNVFLIIMSYANYKSINEQYFRNDYDYYLAKPVTHSALLESFMAYKIYEEGDLQKKVFDFKISSDIREKTKILIVDDDLMNQRVGQEFIKWLGYKSETVSNGEEALEKLSRNPYDIVLMDIHMPIMDGYEATRHIRDSKSKFKVLNRDIPVVAMTAFAGNYDKEKCIEVGMNAHLSKPVDIQELNSVIECQLKGLSFEDTKRLSRSSNEIILNDSKIVDMDALRVAFGGDDKLLNELIILFLKYAPKEFEELNDGLLNEQDADLVERLAHSMKNTFANIKAEAPRAIALKIERACKEQDIAKGRSFLNELRYEYEKVIKYLS